MVQMREDREDKEDARKRKTTGEKCENESEIKSERETGDQR